MTFVFWIFSTVEFSLQIAVTKWAVSRSPIYNRWAQIIVHSKFWHPLRWHLLHRQLLINYKSNVSLVIARSNSYQNSLIGAFLGHEHDKKFHFVSVEHYPHFEPQNLRGWSWHTTSCRSIFASYTNIRILWNLLLWEQEIHNSLVSNPWKFYIFRCQSENNS